MTRYAIKRKKAQSRVKLRKVFDRDVTKRANVRVAACVYMLDQSPEPDYLKNKTCPVNEEQNPSDNFNKLYHFPTPEYRCCPIITLRKTL